MEERTKEQSLLTAEELIKSPYASYRDKGRHMLMDIATHEEWQALAFRFTHIEFRDLRSGVIKRFLESAPEPARKKFALDVVEKCKTRLRNVFSKREIYEESVLMHQILNCLTVVGNDELKSGVDFLHSQFGERLPTPIKKRLKGFHFAPL